MYRVQSFHIFYAFNLLVQNYAVVVFVDSLRSRRR